ncbi:MAG TPA: DUF397 domain-containing protein [Pseudonocardia sp.]|jgi:hypothetical protein|nr:DUF397 domain-containing protein [Pseudonocardia sp.]
MTGQAEQGFRHSSFSGSRSCVEVAQRPDGMIAVRDPKNPAQRELLFTREEWTAFIRGAKAGEFDFGANIGAGVDSATIRLAR